MDDEDDYQDDRFEFPRERAPVDFSPEADMAAMEAEIAEDNLRPLSPDEIEAEAIEDDIHADHRRPSRHHR